MQPGTYRKLGGFVLVAAVISGCATVQVTEPSTLKEKLGRVPELDATSEATVGSTIYSQFRYWSKSGYRLLDPVSTGLMFGSVRAEVGDFVVPAEADGGPAFCTEKKAYIDPMVGPFKSACFQDFGHVGAFDTVTAAPGVVWFKTTLNPPVQYERGELIVPRADAKKSELLYQGYSLKTIKLSYREYLNDFARPAFFQDVTYEVSEFPTIISFRTVRIRVLGADNNGLRYQVLSGF